MKFSTACRNRIRNTLISIVTFALGLGLIASSHAQSYRSKADQEATQTVATKESNGSRVDRDAIRPFRVNIPKEALVDLRRRIAATRWPDKETVTDRSQGVQLEKLQALVRYWGTDYNWRIGGSEAQCLAAARNEHRRTRHSLHSRSVTPPERFAPDHDSWLARLHP